MVVLSEDILSYIDFLIEKQGLFVSMHGRIGGFKEFTKYNTHIHPFCACVKRLRYERCLEQQLKVVEHCENEPFFGTCYAGMGEWIYPIKMEEETVGFISASGYQANIQKDFGTDELRKMAKELMVPPKKTQIDTLLRPLVLLCEIYYKENCFRISDDVFTEKIICYVNAHYTEGITVKHLSDKFNYSVSAISHQFKKKTGMSLCNYVEQLRVQCAKRLLLQTDLGITEIAMLIGCCNSGQLSMIFKKNEGITPMQYRKSKKDSVNEHKARR